MNKGQALRDYWTEVREGIRPPPQRKRGDTLKRTVKLKLDGSFGPDRGKQLVITLHPDGRLEIRPERSRRSESIMLSDVYRYAIRCRINLGALTKARERKAKKAERLAAQRQQRAERRLAED